MAEELSNIRAEAGVIGTLMYHPDFILYSDYLTAQHFFKEENAVLYRTIAGLYEKGISNMDAYNIVSYLDNEPPVRRLREKFNLPSMQEFVLLSKNVARNTREEYEALAKTVTDLAFKRKAVTFAETVKSDCYNSSLNSQELSARIYDKIELLSSECMSTKVKPLGDVVDDAWEEIVRRRTADGSYGIPSAYKAVNKFYTYEKGELVSIQGRLKQGKSFFVLNEAIHKIKLGIATIMFDTEMNDTLFISRVLSNLTLIDTERIKTGILTEDESNRLESAREWLKSVPFYHVYNPDMDENEMYTICRKLINQCDLKFVIYDYIKSNERDASANYNILGKKFDYLKNQIGGKLGLAVLSVAQLNRNNQVADSDKINRYTSVAAKWFLKTTEQKNTYGDAYGNAGLQIYKNRSGPAMDEFDPESYIDFWFDGAKAKISQTVAQHMDIQVPF